MSAPSYKRARAGFTLVELLVVIAIIAVLAALLTPALRAAMDRAHETRTQSRIHQCEIAAQTFFGDYGDYPPATWEELDDVLEYDPDDDDVYDALDALDDTTDPNTINEGIEVFLACVASEQGAYMEPPADMLRNVDAPDADADGVPEGDVDTASDDVAEATNWLFNPTSDQDPIWELVDWWGNPLVYFHNRDYAAHDGEDGGAFEDPLTTDPASAEFLRYAAEDGTPILVYSRGVGGTATGNYPNLGTFQLYSLGLNAEDYLLEGNSGFLGDVLYMPNSDPGWEAGNQVLTNWEE
jgi:prepilin-type N-terminal cleavage/methylation domain-containing protein